MVNFNLVKTLEGGYSSDLTNAAEAKNTYQKATNGRLYSKDGVFSFSGGVGSKLIYQNTEIVKYLGAHVFEDEIVVFAKVLKGGSKEPVVITEDISTINSDLFTITVDSVGATEIDIVDEFSVNSIEATSTYNKIINPPSETEFEDNLVCDGGTDDQIDFSEYYGVNANVQNPIACSINIAEVPVNNEIYWDAIYSMRLNDNYNLVGELRWIGAQNWPVEAKITTEGVEENKFRKPVYYTDAFNVRRVVNLHDVNLPSRTSDEFNQVLNNVLLQPEVLNIEEGGQIKSMTVVYSYRIISENGQLSEFSPTSEVQRILVENTPVEFRGGDFSEATDKKVRIKVNLIDPEDSAEVECVAIELEAFGPPTAIRNLGRKPVKSVVEFDHFGNEAEFADNITFNDIINYKNTWKYCNDFTSKKNKLIAAGLRDQPIPTSVANLEYLFPLHGWDDTGATHDCILNPEPWKYRYIDPTNTEPLVYIKQKVYRNISCFGPLGLTFKNSVTSDEVTIIFSDLGLANYTNITVLVADWLIDQQANNILFASYFPNLTVEKINGQLLLKPTNDLIQTDMSSYVFESNNDQYVETFDNDIQFLPVTVDLDSLVYGGKSIGFDQGNGLRVTYREFTEPLMKKATGIYDGTGTLVDYIEPTGVKFCMKGELYRIGLQIYNSDSTKYFVIPLGDLMIPNMGELKKEITDSGNIIISSSRYLNQSVVGDTLYGHGIKMHIEVRLSCELQEVIPMYQIVYVERTEDNRTILCRGISAPLSRVQTNGKPQNEMPTAIQNKWNIPYNGGPTYEKQGLINYDTYGEDYQYTDDIEYLKRTMVNRSLMYFDSPDIIYGKISDQYVEKCKLQIYAVLNTDHTPGVIRERGGDVSGGSGFNFGDEVYPKFSRKILEQEVDGENYQGDLPRFAREEDYNETWETHFVNVSVFSKYVQVINGPIEHVIDSAESLERGVSISGFAFGVTNDVSNNAVMMQSQPWYYGNFQRKWDYIDGRVKSEIFGGAITSPGYPTVIIKTVTDVFSPVVVGPDIHTVNSQIRLGDDNHVVYDSLPLITLFRNNRESIFGGRTKQAYTANTYIPLSKTIPVLKSSNNAQFFDVGADVYVTLSIRTKNDWGTDPVEERGYNNHGNGRQSGDIEVWQRNGAWTYLFVLESQVEPKLTYGYEFYRVNSKHSFNTTRNEIINNAYFNENNIKTYIPKPFDLKNDPNRGNVIAVSDVKLAGDPYDAWTVFKVNNFYALLEKNKGDVSNIFRYDDNVYAIQGKQTSLIYVGMDRVISDQDGGSINVQQGSGTIIDGHKIISKYGTAIRRAVANGDFGFTFFDETKNEFVRGKDPLLVKNLLHLLYLEQLKENPVIDTEAYYDHENKETGIRLRTKDGTNFMLSYNEVSQKFNGDFEYDNDMYITFKEKVYAPITTGTSGVDLESARLHQLNAGDILNFFEVQKELTLGFYIHANTETIFLYRQWGMVTNLDYPIKSVFFKSNLGYDRMILGTHDAYRIREGTHTVPAINDTDDIEQSGSVRGKWVYVEITAESLNQNKVDILAVLNSLRVSHL